MLEQKLKAAVDSASSASAGGDILLQKRIEDKIEEIQVLLDENEEHRVYVVSEEKENTEFTNQVNQLREELGEMKTNAPATGSATNAPGVPAWSGLSWTKHMPSPPPAQEPPAGTTSSVSPA